MEGKGGLFLDRYVEECGSIGNYVVTQSCAWIDVQNMRILFLSALTFSHEQIIEHFSRGLISLQFISFLSCQSIEVTTIMIIQLFFCKIQLKGSYPFKLALA